MSGPPSHPFRFHGLNCWLVRSLTLRPLRDHRTETLTNTLAIMKLYKSVDPRIKIYQTRWPEGGGATTGGEETTGGKRALRTVPPSALPLLEQVDHPTHVPLPPLLAKSPPTPPRLPFLRSYACQDTKARLRSRRLIEDFVSAVATHTQLRLLNQVDWWCPHVCQWTSPGVPEDMAALRVKRGREGSPRPLHITVCELHYLHTADFERLVAMLVRMLVRTRVRMRVVGSHHRR